MLHLQLTDSVKVLGQHRQNKETKSSGWRKHGATQSWCSPRLAMKLGRTGLDARGAQPPRSYFYVYPLLGGLLQCARRLELLDPVSWILDGVSAGYQIYFYICTSGGLRKENTSAPVDPEQSRALEIVLLIPDPKFLTQMGSWTSSRGQFPFQNPAFPVN